MKRETRYTIQGQVKVTGKVDLAPLELVVLAYVAGQQVARGEVSAKGSYKLSFEWGEQPPTTELRLVPKALAAHADRGLVLTKTLSPHRYVGRHSSPYAYHADYDLAVPVDYATLLWKVTKQYHLHGTVYATTFAVVGGVPAPVAVDPLPGVRCEFYEVDNPWIWPIGSTPTQTESSLGYAYSDPNGAYAFDFSFSHSISPAGMVWLFNDTAPDIRVRISQFIAGLWTAVYEGPVDWNIAADVQRDYFVPIEDVLPVPDNGVKPAEGFRFTSLGLLPIDDTRIVQGYVTSQPGDPVSVTHQPLCSTLRIFGLFASVPAVTSYSVELATADATAATGAWQPLTDALANRRWNATTHAWDVVTMGPDPATGRYTNIDTEPEADWQEHALKITWESANHANGYYALRLTGYDAANTPVGTFEMPILRVDNTPPEASLVATSPAPSACGMLTLGVLRTITFEITAYDSEGHMLEYTLSGTRGTAAGSAGAAIFDDRPVPAVNWSGEQDYGCDFVVAAVPPALATCPAMAYNFELHVWGAPTNCYATKLEAQHVKKETNLVVAEP